MNNVALVGSGDKSVAATIFGTRLVKQGFGIIPIELAPVQPMDLPEPKILDNITNILERLNIEGELIPLAQDLTAVPNDEVPGILFEAMESRYGDKKWYPMGKGPTVTELLPVQAMEPPNPRVSFIVELSRCDDIC